MNMSLKRPTRLMAQESIVSQYDGFGERLESLAQLLVEDVLKDIATQPADLDGHSAVKKIEEEIFNRLGLRVKIIATSHPAAIMAFYSNKNHIFLSEYIRGDLNIAEQNKLLKTMDNRKGSVDIKKAKVTGIFSEYVHPLYLNYYYLVKTSGLTASEIAAVTLHELGHAFYACYYSDRVDETNQVLASVARNIMGSGHGDLEYIYRELEKVSPDVTKAEVDKMLNGPRVVAGAAWFKIVIGMVKSQFTDTTYNQTGFEERADNFASRFGYGKEIIVALDKLYQGSPEKSESMRIFVQLVSASVFTVGALLIFSLIATGSIVTAFVFAILKLVMLQFHREDLKDHTYDNLKSRYMRIRQDIVDQLKDRSIPRDVATEMISSIASIDSVIKSTSEVKVLPEVIANFVFSSARNAERSINDQKLMEALASNDLFVTAAKFKQ